MVYQALQGRMGGELHALALQTGVPTTPERATEPRQPSLSRVEDERNDQQSVTDRIKKDIDEQRRRAVHEGHARVPAMRLLRRRGPGAEPICGTKFKGIDVLEDPSMRQGIKEFSNWPTIPQLYVKGEFVGGCDIVREMYQTGELQELLESRGVKVEA